VVCEGADADILIWDPKKPRTISKNTHHQNIDFNIFEGMEVEGINVVTISQGEVVFRDGEITAKAGRGRYIKRPLFSPASQALQKNVEYHKPVPVHR